MKRRDLLKCMAAAPLLSSTTRLYAAPQASARILVVFMRGGYDAANLLVPVSSDFYYETRPNIAVPRPGAAPNGALPLDADWGLHPSLRDTIFPLYQKGQAAFVPFAGTDELSRSHFETQDSIEFGQPPGGRRDYGSGFLGRLAGVLSGARPIAFTDQLPVILRGDRQIPNIGLRSLGRPGVDTRQSANITAMFKKTALETQVSEGFSVRNEILQEMASAMAAADRNAVTARGFELEARRIAKLMKSQFNIGFVDVGGWDTHVGQGGATGYLAGRLEELGRALAGFATEIGPEWQDTVVVVVSEFGRTFRENGNGGTDHGHGSVYWVLGGGIRGGRVAGDQERLAQSTLHQNRDYPVRNEYRAVFGGLFAQMYGLNPAQLERIFAGVAAKDLNFI